MEKINLFAMLSQRSGDPYSDMTYWAVIALIGLGIFVMLAWLCIGK